MFRLMALLIILSTTSVSAGFVNNKNDLDGLTEGAKIGYVFGVFDLSTGMSNDNKEHDLLSRKLYKCAVEKSLRDSDFIEIIEQGYNERSTREHPPFLYLLDGLQKLCNL